MLSARYVKGEMRYMKIQNWGKAPGAARTPQKINVSEKSKLPIFPAVSAVSMAAMTMVENVDVKRRNCSTRRKKRKPRS